MSAGAIGTPGGKYKVSQEERSVFLGVIVSAILGKNVDMCTCPIPSGFQNRAVSLYSPRI
jgi:hypothetical protein